MAKGIEYYLSLGLLGLFSIITLLGCDKKHDDISEEYQFYLKGCGLIVCNCLWNFEEHKGNKKEAVELLTP